jgi:two-component system, OmpR family, sensor kinase
MAEPSHLTRFWRSLRALPDRTPLRVKLITAVLALVAIALAVISLTGISVLKGYLLNQSDNTIQSYTFAVNHNVEQYLSNGNQYSSQVIAAAWVPSGGKLAWVVEPTKPNYGFQLGGAPTQPQLLPGPQISTNPAWLAANSGRYVTVPGQSGGDLWRVYLEPVNLNGPNGSTTGTVIIGVDVTNVFSTIDRLASLDLIVSVLLLLLLLIVGIAVVRASLRPLTDIERTAGAIAKGDLTRRVPDRDPRTEVGRLGQSLNTMLSQIESAFDARAESEFAARRSEERMRQFVADASHELRTPLTAIRGYAEYYRQRGGVNQIASGPASRPAIANGTDTAAASLPAEIGQEAEGPLNRDELDRIMQRVEQESSRMGVLVEDMLLLARLDQQRPLERGTVDMLTLAADAVNDARVMAPDRGINLTVGSGTALLVVGDEVRLRQVIGNLMSNALNHTPEGTPIEARVRLGDLDEWRAAAAKAGRAEIAAARPSARPTPAVVFEVADRGPGLTPEQASHVFERFYRGDQARTRKSGGTGLGLSIVAALVAAHGGAVWVESPPGGGATFHIAIPLAPEARYSSAEPDDGTDPGTGGPPPGLGDVSGRGPGPGAFPGPGPVGSRAGPYPRPAPGPGAFPSPPAGPRPGAFQRAWRTSTHPRGGEEPPGRPFPPAPPPPPPPPRPRSS